jgi:hypothetical protein
MKRTENQIRLTKGGFYFKPFSKLEFVLLFLLLTFEILILYFKYYTNRDLDLLSKIDALTFVLIWWLPLVSGIGNFFRNIYFSLSWFVICIIWFILKDDFTTAIIPLMIFLYVQLARFLFKFIFKYEPIFLMVGKFYIEQYSEIEKRPSKKVDFIFSMLTMIVGGIISIIMPSI